MIKIALYGGSFDPVHLGHINLADAVVRQFDLDRLIFIPASQAPLKDNSPAASPAQRLAMLHLALEKHGKLTVSQYDLLQNGLSFSINTIKAFSQSEVKLYWLIGDDQLIQLNKWDQYPEHFKYCDFIVLPRDPQLDIKKICREHAYSSQLHPADTEFINISSTEIKNCITGEKNVSIMLPEQVENYINLHQLYR